MHPPLLPISLPPLLPLPDPIGTVTGFLGNQFLGSLTAVLRALQQDFLRQLGGPVLRYVLHTPDLLAEPTLRRYWLISLASSTACAGLLVALAGLTVATGDASRLGRSARSAVAVRLPGCLLTAAVSLPLVALEVALANRLVDAFVSDGFATGSDPLWVALRSAASGDAGAGLALLVTASVGVVLLALLVVVGLARWATLWLLIVLAPIAMLFALLPGGEPVARVWWRLQLAAVFLPVCNAVLLGTYVAMFASDRTSIVGALSGVAVLALMAKLPAWAGGAAVGVEAADVLHRARRGSRLVQGTTRSPSAGRSAGAPTRATSAPTL